MRPREARAKELVARLPLVHYPANARLDDWSNWTALKSRESLGRPLEPGPFGALRGRHVFVYAGPCCYYHEGAVGDAAMYFAPGTETERGGSATPFDSGSLEDDPPRLQPFRARRASLDERWSFFVAHEIRPLGTFRARFAEWLIYAYDDPDAYLDTVPDRWSAGEPQRLDPPELLEHNGSRGRAKHGEGECGDRRAWTWELRIERELPLDSIAVLQVPYDSVELAGQLADRLRARTGRSPRIELLPRDLPCSYDSIYEQSGIILRAMVDGGATS